jgi:uncharacterized protein YihD (DUF1040 family)
MENKELNNLVEVSLNPYLILKLELNHSEEEIKSMIEKMSSKFQSEYEKNALEVETSYNTTFIFIKESFLHIFRKQLKELGFKYILNDATDEIFNMKDLSIFTNIDSEDPCPEFTKQYFPDMVSKKDKIMNILKFNFNQKYSIDDVIDKIGKDGVESLNELNKGILNEG